MTDERSNVSKFETLLYRCVFNASLPGPMPAASFDEMHANERRQTRHVSDQRAAQITKIETSAR